MAQQNPSLPNRQVIAPPRPAHATDRYDGPTMLYRLYDADGRLLYIGVTCNPQQRWDGHRGDKPWWPLVARKELTTYPDRSAALTAERDAIRTEKPLHNVTGNPRNRQAHAHLVLSTEQAAKVRALAEELGVRSNSEVFYALLDTAQTGCRYPETGDQDRPGDGSHRVDEPLYGTAADRIRDQLREPTDLEVAVHVAQELLHSDQVLALREALRILLRAIGAEPLATPAVDAPPVLRCPAAHPDDTSPCNGPAVVTVLDRGNAGADGCEHHAARLLASLEGGRVVPLPHAPEGSAVRVFKASDGLRPFAWLEGQR